MKKSKNKRPDLIIDFSTYNHGYDEGIKAAAAFVEMFDSTVNHDYRLSDCILAKFNKLPKKKIRKNKRKHVIVGIWNRKNTKLNDLI